MSSAIALPLRDGDRARLADLARLPSVPSGLARRARIVLLAADGLPNAQIARLVGVSRPTVIGWRERYQQGGIKALEDEPRPGRPPRVDEVDVVVATLAGGGRPPQRLGIPHWSARCLAAELGISFATVARIWRRWGIEPRLAGSFKFATEPGLVSGIRDVVGLYLNPPDLAVVVSVEQTFQVSAADRTVPARRGVPEWRTRDHKRYGTAALFAALEAASASPPSDLGRPRPQEFLRFLKGTAAANPGVGLHVLLDSNRARGPAEVRRWLARAGNQRISLHVPPADCPWLTMVEIFAGLVNQAARRGTLRPVKDLTAAIGAFAGTGGDEPRIFTWIKNAGESPTHFRQ